MMAGCRAWLEGHKDVIAAVKDLVTICAAVIALISIIVAVSQLRITAANIKSNTVYQISHEGREIAKTITGNMPADRIGPVVNFIHSVWNQHRFGTLDDELWGPFQQEVCEFLRSQSNFSEYWNRNRQLFSKDFGIFVEERRKECV
ncbi:MAG: hypothetical protein ACRDGM_02665 [bacterium]